MLLDAVLRQDQVLGLAVLGDALGEGRLSVHGDEAPVDRLALPAGLEPGLEGDEEAGDDGEDDEEDAGAGVGACVGRGPVCAEEGRHDGVLEGRGVAAAMAVRTAAAVAAHVHRVIVARVAHDIGYFSLFLLSALCCLLCLGLGLPPGVLENGFAEESWDGGGEYSKTDGCRRKKNPSS